jgi:hypothetical protein
MYNLEVWAVAYQSILSRELQECEQNDDSLFTGGRMAVVARSLPKRKSRTRRVDKGKSGQAQKTAVSGGFGGGILSQDLKANG